MAAVIVREPLADDQPQPEEGWQVGAFEVPVQVGRGVKESILEHVGGVDPAVKPRVHPQLDHAAQAVSVALEQVGQGLSVASAEPRHQMLGVAAIVRHRCPPLYSIYMRSAAFAGQVRPRRPRPGRSPAAPGDRDPPRQTGITEDGRRAPTSSQTPG